MSFVRLDQAGIPDEESVPVYLKDLRFSVILHKQVFKNKDGSTRVRNLVTNEETMEGDQFKTIYKKRWSVEVYHESIKQNTSIGSSAARMMRTQGNHIFVSIYGYVKDEYKHLCICCGLSKNRCPPSYGPMREPDGYPISIPSLYGVF
jgi:hypothetical protein